MSPDDAIDELRQLVRDQAGPEFSREEAEAFGSMLVQLMANLTNPTIMSDDDAVDSDA